MNNIYCIVGPSGIGKTTVCDLLAERYGYHVVASYTDRPARTPHEKGHMFLTREEFDKLENICAYTMFNGHRYGVTADLIEQNDLYVIDPAGIRYMQEQYHGTKQVKVIGLTAERSTLIARMKKRGDSEAKIRSRLENDEEMFRDYKVMCDILIPSDDLETMVTQIYKFIQENN